MNAQRFCILDYETRSKADLKKVGSYEYARHPSTQILCVAWRVGTREELRAQLDARIRADVWSPALPSPYGGLIRALTDPTVKLVAHGAFFEQVITRFVLGKIHRQKLPLIPISRWICTAALAASYALPRGLEGSCLALDLPVQKDMEGRRLMLKLSKPRKPTKHNPAIWHNSMSDLLRVMNYCVTDTDAETELFLRLPELPPHERQVWELDQKINWRGYYVDRKSVENALDLLHTETESFKARCTEITNGEVSAITKVAQCQAWLAEQGVILPNMRANTIRDAITDGLASPGSPAEAFLKLRAEAAKSSTKKYKAFEAHSRSDSRVRNGLVYHRASTGRWGGSGVQPQNFPRGSIKDTETAIELINSRDIELLRLCYGRPMEVFSSCLRGMIMATPGKEIFCADYAAIEARVLFWIAHHADGIAAFRDNRPIYEEMGAVIFKKPVSEIANPSIERDLGKRAILGCGYGMGDKKFRATCKEQGNLEISEELSKRAVKAYRDAHSPVVQLWYNLEKAAIRAVQKPGHRIRVNRTLWWVEDGFLFCTLPSGRRLSFYGPKIKYESVPWNEEEKRAVLYHWGVDSKTHKWVFAGTYGGKLTENVVQATARDLMAFAMLGIEAAGYGITLSVHDELKAERNKGEGSLEEFEALMTKLPAWAGGCPVTAKGWVGQRYRK